MNELTQVSKAYLLRNGLYQTFRLWLDFINQTGRCLEMNELYQTLVLLEWIVPNFESARIVDRTDPSFKNISIQEWIVPNFEFIDWIESNIKPAH